MTTAGAARDGGRCVPAGEGVVPPPAGTSGHAAFQRLRRIFPDRIAAQMAAAGHDVVTVVPIGWAALPIDEHLARIGGAA